MKTTLQAFALILFIILFHLTIISSFGLMAWACMAVCCASVFIWLCKGGQVMSRLVIGRNNWPEYDQKDFLVLVIDAGESDQSAIERAATYYDDVEFYIIDTEEESNLSEYELYGQDY